ncbi:MAG: hypothetical protein ABMA26_17825 [Limisphaerales bacterium]
MKRGILFAVCALVLAFGLISLGRRGPKPSIPSTGPPADNDRVVAKMPKAKPQPVMEAKRFSWREVESDDYRQYVVNLRRINVPEQTLVDIVVADVNRLYVEKANKLKVDNWHTLQYKYWQVVGAGTTNRAAIRLIGAALEALDRERVRLIGDLLGSEIKDPLALQKPEAFKIGAPTSVFTVDFLPEPKRVAFKSLQDSALAEARATIADGATDDRSMQLRRTLQAKLDAELTKILSPEEKQEYDSRYSFVAQHLRSALNGFQPTEAEFNQIVALSRRFHDEFESPYTKDDAMRIPDKLRAKREVDAQLSQALGVERFQELQRGLDVDYGRDTRFAAEVGLRQETVNGLYDLRERLRQAAAPSNPPATWEQDLQAARGATLNLLGEDAYRAYTNRLDGRWLTGTPKSLAPLIIGKGVLIRGR